MPSFDIVAEVDSHELTNAVDQMNREVSNRFDFKGSDAKVILKEYEMNFEAVSDFHIAGCRHFKPGIKLVVKRLQPTFILARWPQQHGTQCGAKG